MYCLFGREFDSLQLHKKNPNILKVRIFLILKNKKVGIIFYSYFICGPTWARTKDLLIMSQLL